MNLEEKGAKLSFPSFFSALKIASSTLKFRTMNQNRSLLFRLMSANL